MSDYWTPFLLIQNSKFKMRLTRKKNKKPHCRICGKRAARWRRVKKWRPFDCFKSAKHSFYRRRRDDPANCALTEFSSSRLGKVSKLPLLALAASVAAFLRNFFGKSCKEKIYITKHKIIITTKNLPQNIKFSSNRLVISKLICILGGGY